MRKMIDQQTLAGIGSMAELRQHRQTIEACAATRRTQLDLRRQQLTARLTPTYIVGYLATRTESAIAIFSLARRLYSIAQTAVARMKKG